MKHFEKAKDIFSVSGKGELTEKLKKYGELEKQQITYDREDFETSLRIIKIIC